MIETNFIFDIAVKGTQDDVFNENRERIFITTLLPCLRWQHWRVSTNALFPLISHPKRKHSSEVTNSCHCHLVEGDLQLIPSESGGWKTSTRSNAVAGHASYTFPSGPDSSTSTPFASTSLRPGLVCEGVRLRVVWGGRSISGYLEAWLRTSGARSGTETTIACYSRDPEPIFILFDEPTSALNPTIALLVEKALRGGNCVWIIPLRFRGHRNVREANIIFDRRPLYSIVMES